VRALLPRRAAPVTPAASSLDAARPRTYLNEPSFSPGPALDLQDPAGAEKATATARTAQNDKRARILDAAIKVFAGRGFHSATVAEIAKGAGVADGTIYLYFKGKDDLLLRLFDEKMTELLAEARAELAKEKSAPDRLQRFIQLHLALVERNPDLASVLIVELRQSAQFLKSADRAKLSAYVDLIAEVVSDGQENGELERNISPAVVKRAIFGALDELALSWLLSGRRTSLKKTAAEVAGWLVRGLKAR
jgi:TetR/AcrR family transcriptional regulator, fatty acid metabolism regulator protein